jgi:hypothetical protein
MRSQGARNVYNEEIFIAVMIEVMCSSEMLVTTYKNTQKTTINSFVIYTFYQI